MLPQGLIGKLLCAIVDDFQWVIVDLRGHESFTTKDYTATTININRLLSPPKGKFIKSVCAWFVCGRARCQRCCKVCWKYTLKNLAAIASTLFFIMLQSYPRSLCLQSKVSLGNWTIFDDILLTFRSISYHILFTLHREYIPYFIDPALVSKSYDSNLTLWPHQSRISSSYVIPS